MRLVLEKRAEASGRMAILSPIIAILLTLVTGGIIFALRGLNPFSALYVFFVEPLTTAWSIEQLIVKATPLAMIGAGLAVSYMANVWNIGAEGQLTAGAILGSAIPVFFPEFQSPFTLQCGPATLETVLAVAAAARTNDDRRAVFTTARKQMHADRRFIELPLQ